MKKILWLLILFMPFIYGMEDRKRKNAETDQTQEKKTKFSNIAQANDATQDGLLRAAVFANDILEVKILLEEGVNPDINIDLPASPAKSLLIYAIEQGFNEIVELLNDKCIKRPDTKEFLYAAIVGNNIKIVQILLDQGISPNIIGISQNNKTYSLAQFAIKKGFNELAKLLMDKGSPDKLDDLLIPAIEGNNIECVKYLITNNISLNVNLLDKGKSISLVKYAATHNYLDLVELLVNAGAPYPQKLFSSNGPFVTRRGNANSDNTNNESNISSMHSEDKTTNFDNSNNENDIPSVDLEISEIPTKKQELDQLVMKLVKEKKYIHVKHILKKIGMIPNVLEDEIVKIIVSKELSSIELMKKLLDLCDFECCTLTWTLIEVCARSYNKTSLPKLNYLINKIKAPYLIETSKKYFNDIKSRWLCNAVANNQLENVHDLLKSFVNPNINYLDQNIPLIHIAMNRGYHEITKLLIQYGAIVPQANSNQASYEPKQSLSPQNIKNAQPELSLELKLIQAFKKGDIKVIKALLNHTNVNLADEKGLNGLMHAILLNSEEIVKLYVYYGVNLNHIDSNGWSALFWAVNTNNISIVDYLISNTASLHQKDHKGLTALAHSIMNKSAEISKLLYKCGTRL